MFGLRPFFFADYRDIRDALSSSRQRISNDFLLRFLGGRGIIFNASTSRDTLIEAVAVFAYEAADLDEICDQLEVQSRRDRLTYTTFPGTVSSETIREALNNVKAERRIKNERIESDRVSGEAIAIDVDYYEMHAGRTVLKQMQPKHGTIKIMKVGDEMRIRYPSNERVSGIVQQLVESVNALIPPETRSEPTVVDLSGFDKLQRTQFFQGLTAGVEGYKVFDVMKVNLNSEIHAVEFSVGDEFDDDQLSDEDEGNAETGVAAAKGQLESEMRAVLKRASLDGSGILHAAELKRFLESGFYISRIVWAVRPRSKRMGSPKVEFEALLANPAAGTGFAYNIKAIYRAKRNKTYNKSPSTPNDNESAALLAALEKAVQNSFGKVAITD